MKPKTQTTEELRFCVWHVAAYGSGETKFYAVKSCSDTIASEIATEPQARILAKAPGMLAALLEIYAVATGETQVSHDDTGALEWTAKRIKNLLDESK